MRPSRKSTIFPALSLVLLLPQVTLADEGQESPDPRRSVTEFVTSIHIHGVDYSGAKALGLEAIPILKDLLADESMRWRRSEIVITLGFIGEEQCFEILRSYVWDTFEGDVDYQTFQALCQAQSAIGFVKSPRTVPYLQKGCDPANWSKIRWATSGHRGADLRYDLCEGSIRGLSYTGDSRARRTLKHLESHPVDARQRTIIKEAIQRYDEVAAVGFEEYQRRGGTVRLRRNAPAPPLGWPLDIDSTGRSR